MKRKYLLQFREIIDFTSSTYCKRYQRKLRCLYTLTARRPLGLRPLLHAEQRLKQPETDQLTDTATNQSLKPIHHFGTAAGQAACLSLWVPRRFNPIFRNERQWSRAVTWNIYLVWIFKSMHVMDRRVCSLKYGFFSPMMI